MRQVLGSFFHAIQQKIPAWNDLLSVFAACTVPVYIWAILIFFSHVEAILLRGTIFQLLATAGLVFLFALLESGALFLLFLTINILLPASWFFDRFVAIGAGFAILTSLWAVSIHMQGPIDRNWNLIPFFIMLAASYIVIYKSSRFEKILEQVALKLVVVAAFYIALTFMGLAFYLPQLFIKA